MKTAPRVRSDRSSPKRLPGMVLSIWKRHGLDTPEKRRSSVLTGEALPDAPGFVLSPYKSRVRMQVPAADWEPRGARAVRRPASDFLLPDRLPPLQAQLVTADPGTVVSPLCARSAFSKSIPRIGRAAAP